VLDFICNIRTCIFIPPVDKLRHPRFDAYSAAQVLPNKQQIWCGGAYLYTVINTCLDISAGLFFLTFNIDIVMLADRRSSNNSIVTVIRFMKARTKHEVDETAKPVTGPTYRRFHAVPQCRFY